MEENLPSWHLTRLSGFQQKYFSVQIWRKREKERETGSSDIFTFSYSVFGLILFWFQAYPKNFQIEVKLNCKFTYGHIFINSLKSKYWGQRDEAVNMENLATNSCPAWGKSISRILKAFCFPEQGYVFLSFLFVMTQFL